MPRKKGEPKTGGRKKGTPNKTTSSAKQNILAVCEGIGDIGGMIIWARANRTDFYKLYARLLPHEMSGPDGGPISADEPLDYEDMARRLLFVLEGATYKMAIVKAAKAAAATGNATKKAATKEDVIARRTEEELEAPPSAPTLPWCDPDE